MFCTDQMQEHWNLTGANSTRQTREIEVIMKARRKNQLHIAYTGNAEQ